MMSKLVPKLRFKEFSGEWEEKQLKNVCSMQAGKFVSASEIYNDVLKGLNPCFGGNGLRCYTRSHTHIGEFPLIGRQGEHCGNVNFATGKFHATEHAVVATPLKQTNVFWLYYSLINLKLNQYATGQAQPGLSVKVLESITVHIPKDEKEQQKIANTLSSLDNLIKATTKKVEALKKHKKGLMQQLFPEEGEKTPRLRFKEFSGEWEETFLLNISKITTGSSNREDSTTNSGKYTFFDRSEDIRTSHKYLFDDEAVIVAGEGQKFTPKYFNGKFDLHQRTYAILELNIIGKFLYFYIDKNKDYFLRYAVGSTVKSLRQPIFEQMPILLPTLPEQQKIADTLSSLDTLIEAQNKKVEALKVHKKSLMQQMFVSGDS